ncbi:hypothetical protein J6590_069288, partial [Homalodisca vitripennis]
IYPPQTTSFWKSTAIRKRRYTDAGRRLHGVVGGRVEGRFGFDVRARGCSRLIDKSAAIFVRPRRAALFYCTPSLIHQPFPLPVQYFCVDQAWGETLQSRSLSLRGAVSEFHEPPPSIEFCTM